MRSRAWSWIKSPGYGVLLVGGAEKLDRLLHNALNPQTHETIAVNATILSLAMGSENHT